MKFTSYTLILTIGIIIFNSALAESKEKVRAWGQMTEEPIIIETKADMKNGANVYEICAACHLDEGWGREDGTFPQIAGQHRSVLVKQLADISAGNRDFPTMIDDSFLVGGATIVPQSLADVRICNIRINIVPQSLADVTAYISTLLMNPNNGFGEGNDLKHGEKLYKENCVKCHGETGYGSAEKFYPRIQAQHYKYMLRQFEWIRDGKRRNANPDMVRQIKSFTEKDMKAVIDYASRLRPPKKDIAPPDWVPPGAED